MTPPTKLYRLRADEEVLLAVTRQLAKLPRTASVADHAAAVIEELQRRFPTDASPSGPDVPTSPWVGRIRDSGLSQAEIARKLGVSSQAVSFWATGKKQPSHQMAVQLDRLFTAQGDHS